MEIRQLWSFLFVIVIEANFTCGVLQCFECSDFPREEYSEDEEMGTCPGWLRPPRTYPEASIYDGCMTILLANGTVVSQNAILFNECSNYQKSLRIELRNLFGISVRIRCCKGERCNAPRKLQAKLSRISEQKEKMAKESYENAGVDPNLTNAMKSHQRGDKLMKDGSSLRKDSEGSTLCCCKGYKHLSLEKQAILTWTILLRALFI